MNSFSKFRHENNNKIQVLLKKIKEQIQKEKTNAE